MPNTPTPKPNKETTKIVSDDMESRFINYSMLCVLLDNAIRRQLH